ncbi:enoyl-CoA hydratase-isomerase [Escherichia coli]|nr:enoyl-CoA hydratase-isomerase [Escherichia coli]
MSELIVSRQQRVLLLTLNRPAARNALNNALLMQLVNELEAAATDTSISVCVITGNARFFAAGADLNEMAEKDLAATLNDTRPQLWARLQAFNKPLIAAVNGYALGAGCELALLCDVVVAGENARFGLPEITLGIMPGAGGTQRLIRSVGKSLASKMVLSGESITAQQAQQAGLVSDVFPSDLTLEYALQLASKMARHSPLALQAASKRCASRRKWLCKPDLPRSDSYSPCWRQQKIVMKASPLSYKNARPTLKDANDGIHPQSCRKGRDDTNAQPPGTPEQF